MDGGREAKWTGRKWTVASICRVAQEVCRRPEGGTEERAVIPHLERQFLRDGEDGR